MTCFYGIVPNLKTVEGHENDVLTDVSKALSSFNAKIIHIYTETALDPDFGQGIDSLKISQTLKNALKQEGIYRLYKYQGETIERILKGDNIMVISGTGTGKTEAFLIPIWRWQLREKDLLWSILLRHYQEINLREYPG